jgi:CMP-N-acetylneuraminic acid synthetase
MKIYGFIFVRGGSKGVPKKNIKEINGIPLIKYKIDIGSQSKYINKIFVSTDSEEIINVIKNYNVEIIKRPDELASDTSNEFLSWKHASQYVYNKYGDEFIFVSLPAVTPLIKIDSIDNAIELFINDKPNSVVSICESSINPYYNSFTIESNHLKKIFDNNIIRRQDSPQCYNITGGFYITTNNFIKNNNSLYDGSVMGYTVSKIESFDIDDNIDFEIVSYFLKSTT